MRLPDNRHYQQTWVVHSINAGLELEDVWQFPIEARSDQNLAMFRDCFFQVFRDLETRGISGFLFKLRFLLGKIFGWDKKPARIEIRAGSLRERYSRLPGAVLPEPETGEKLPFEWVYQLENETLSEIENKTCHAALHMGWVALDEDRRTVQMAVYVRPNGRLGRFYMALIRPFRHWIVYPTMMRMAGRAWRRMHESEKLQSREQMGAVSE